MVRLGAVEDRLDLLVCAGAALEPDRLRRMRERGCKIVNYKGGNGAVISMEAMIARPPPRRRRALLRRRPLRRRLADAAALGHLPRLVRDPLPLPGAPGSAGPWRPIFLEAAAAAAGPGFGYQPGRRPWRVGIMDPNITVMKTSHMPMLVCEAAFRAAPDAFAAFYVANSQAHRDNAHFASFTTHLTAAQAGKLTLEPRYVGAQFLAHHCDALVTHQWENALNYLYWEALHGGYPLIHNSPMLDGLGYRYPNFDAEAGAKVLLGAVAGTTTIIWPPTRLRRLSGLRIWTPHRA